MNTHIVFKFLNASIDSLLVWTDQLSKINHRRALSLSPFLMPLVLYKLSEGFRVDLIFRSHDSFYSIFTECQNKTHSPRIEINWQQRGIPLLLQFQRLEVVIFTWNSSTNMSKNPCFSSHSCKNIASTKSLIFSDSNILLVNFMSLFKRIF